MRTIASRERQHSLEMSLVSVCPKGNVEIAKGFEEMFPSPSGVAVNRQIHLCRRNAASEWKRSIKAVKAYKEYGRWNREGTIGGGGRTI